MSVPYRRYVGRVLLNRGTNVLNNKVTNYVPNGFQEHITAVPGAYIGHTRVTIVNTLNRLTGSVRIQQTESVKSIDKWFLYYYLRSTGRERKILWMFQEHSERITGVSRKE